MSSILAPIVVWFGVIFTAFPVLFVERCDCGDRQLAGGAPMSRYFKHYGLRAKA
jgi:hypothetical protein